MPDRTITVVQWSAVCQQCEHRWTFDNPDHRDTFVKNHRWERNHRVQAGTVNTRRPLPPTHTEAIVNVVNILGIERVISDELM